METPTGDRKEMAATGEKERFAQRTRIGAVRRL
jgi:hypothetical protein